MSSNPPSGSLRILAGPLACVSGNLRHVGSLLRETKGEVVLLSRLRALEAAEPPALPVAASIADVDGRKIGFVARDNQWR